MAGRGSCRVPERWTQYSPLGRRMAGTRFVAFKVPLRKSFGQNLLPEQRFSPRDLLRKVQERKEELGLIIDLTYTTRYYSREDLPRSMGYCKILTRGHEIPNRKTFLRFRNLVRRFLMANRDNGEPALGLAVPRNAKNGIFWGKMSPNSDIRGRDGGRAHPGGLGAPTHHKHCGVLWDWSLNWD
uniref:DUS11 phosphatase n=1 Tax=Junco hyemalis TaxID=40217 RepID=A0A8C5ICP5_JUNHY